jgi:hypothetical protein
MKRLHEQQTEELSSLHTSLASIFNELVLFLSQFADDPELENRNILDLIKIVCQGYAEEVARREEDRLEFQRILEEKDRKEKNNSIEYGENSSCEKIKRLGLKNDPEGELREKEHEKECINELNQTIEDMYIQQKLINSEKKVSYSFFLS